MCLIQTKTIAMPHTHTPTAKRVNSKVKHFARIPNRRNGTQHNSRTLFASKFHELDVRLHQICSYMEMWYQFKNVYNLEFKAHYFDDKWHLGEARSGHLYTLLRNMYILVFERVQTINAARPLFEFHTNTFNYVFNLYTNETICYLQYTRDGLWKRLCRNNNIYEEVWTEQNAKCSK